MASSLELWRAEVRESTPALLREVAQSIKMAYPHATVILFDLFSKRV